MLGIKQKIDEGLLDAGIRLHMARRYILGVFAASALVAIPAEAQQKLSDISGNVEEEAGQLALGFLVVMALIGLFMVGIGIMKLLKGADRGESPANAFKHLLVGALLIAIPGILAIINSSIFDGAADTSYLDELDIG